MMNVFVEVVVGFWGTLTKMAPYLLFGFAVAGLLSIWISSTWVDAHLGQRRHGSVVKASLFGVPLPLCSCSVLPVAASLRSHGAGRGATTAFLLSTPQTGVDSIFVTYGLLGPVFAVFRPLAAFLTGVLGGWLTDATAPADTPEENTQAVCCDKCCAQGTRLPWYWRAFHHGFVVLPRDVGSAMVVGLMVAGVISAIVPDDFFAGAIGTGFVAMLVMMLLGIPVYVCATASVPIAAALIAKGVTPGAALVFLIAGPATNAASITTLWKTLGGRTTVIYMLTVAISALLAGLCLDWLFTIPALPQPVMHHPMATSWTGHASAILLLLVLLLPVFVGKHAQQAKDTAVDENR